MKLWSLPLFLIVSLGATGLPSTEDPVAVERRMAELTARLDEHRTAGEPDRARGLLLRMIEIDREHPKVFIAIAGLHLGQRTWAEAAVEMRTVGSDGPGLTYGLALLDRYARDYDAALNSTEDAVEAYRSIEHAAGLAAAHNLRGTTMRKKKRHDEAAAELRAAIPYLESLGDRKSVADVLSNVGMVAIDRRRPQEAMELELQALAIREQLGDVLAQSKSWLHIARAHWRLRERDAAIAAAEKALHMRIREGDLLGEHSAWREIAWFNFALLRYDAAASAYREAVSAAERLGDRSRIAKSSSDLGRALVESGSHAHAVLPLERAVGLFRELERPESLGAPLQRLGRARLRLGEYARAGELLREAASLARKHGDASLEALALTDLAGVFLATGELADALADQERAREIFGTLRDRHDELVGLNNLGAIYYRLGDLDAAQGYLEETLALARELEDVYEIARAEANLGVVLVDSERVEEGLGHLTASTERWRTMDDRRGVAFGRFNAAGALSLLDRSEDARQSAEQALQGFRIIGDREGETFSLNLSASLMHDAGLHEPARTRYGQALEFAREYGFVRQEWMAYAGRAALLEDAGNNKEALADYRAAIDRVERLRAHLEGDEFKTRFLAGKMELYERAADLQARIDGAPAAAAFELAERGRARSLVELLAESRQSLRATVPAELIARERDLLDEVGAAAARLTGAPDTESRTIARRKLDAAEQRLHRLKFEIRRTAPSYALAAYPDPVTLPELQNDVLRQDETLLAYFVGDRQAMVWLVDREGVSFRRLAAPAAIENAVTRFLDRAGDAGMGSADSRAEALAELVLPDVTIPAGRTLIVAADGPLHHVPFGALRRNGRYLVEDHGIVVAPSATALRLMRDRPSPVASDGFIGFGDPVATDDGREFEPLPYSRVALPRIAAMFPEERRVVISGEALTRESLRAQPLDRYRYAHFATHGWFDAERPRHGGLRLSDSDVHLDELFTLQLAAELVVLSSCRSGQGELLRGEGLISMTRAFLHAGARSLLVSLWNVSDRSTAEFMEAFYGRIREGLSSPEALRRTQLQFLASERVALREPYHWASFVLVGNPEPQGRESD